MLWFLLILVLLTLILVLSRFCYKLAFYSRNTGEQDIYVIPPGKQYEAVADKILAVIGEVDALPYEMVSITAFDGVRLAAPIHGRTELAPYRPHPSH